MTDIPSPKLGTETGDYCAVVRLTRNLENNFNKRKFHIIKRPKVKGIITKIPTSDLQSYHNVKLAFRNGKHNIGGINISHKNFIFNCLGYLTYDTYLPM